MAFAATGQPALRPNRWRELQMPGPFADIPVYLEVHLRLEVAMTTITIALPDDRLLKLKEMANRFGVVPEELVRVSIEELLTRPEEAFERAVDYVFKKNAELYRRLA
jgi:hypothetical protein